MHKKQTILGIGFFVAIATLLGILVHDAYSKATKQQPLFWNGASDVPVSYFYAPAVFGSEIIMGRYCPRFTARTGEIISFKSGGNVIGHPHTAVLFPEINTKKPTKFTLNPVTACMNSVRRVIFPIAEYYFSKKYEIAWEDNPLSSSTVANYFPQPWSTNLAQKKDIQALKRHFEKHVNKHYPNTNVVLYGDSRGAATIFNFIALHNPAHVKAAVLEGIFDCIPHVIKHFLYDDKNPFIEKQLYTLFSMLVRKYRHDGTTPRKCAEIITDDIPLLFVISLKDGLISAQNTFWLYKRLKQRGFENIHLLVLKNSAHPAYMMDDPRDRHVYETTVHAFYRHYGLPHNAEKAAQGRASFAASQPTIEELSERYVLKQCEMCA